MLANGSIVMKMPTQTADAFSHVLGSHRGDGAAKAPTLENEIKDLGYAGLLDDITAGNVIDVVCSLSPESIDGERLVQLLSDRLAEDIHNKALPILRKMLKGCRVNSFHAKTISISADGLAHLHPPAHQLTQDGSLLRKVVPLCMQRFDERLQWPASHGGKMEGMVNGEWNDHPHCPVCAKHQAYFVETLAQGNEPLPQPWNTLAITNADSIITHTIHRWIKDDDITLTAQLSDLSSGNKYSFWKKSDGISQQINQLAREALYRMWVTEYLEGVLLYLRSGHADLMHECLMKQEDRSRSNHKYIKSLLSEGDELSDILDVNWRVLLAYWFLMQSKEPEKLYSHAWSKEYPELVNLAIKDSANPKELHLFNYLKGRVDEQ